MPPERNFPTPDIKDISPDEDAAIRRAIKNDPDTWEAPADAPALRQGRELHKQRQGKAQITIRLDRDIIKALQTPQKKGWQTRLNAILRKALRLEQA